MKIVDIGFKDFTDMGNIVKYYSYLCAHSLDTNSNLGNEIKGDYINLPDCKIEKVEPLSIKLYDEENNVASYRFLRDNNTGGVTLLPLNINEDGWPGDYIVTMIYHIDLDGITSASMVYNCIKNNYKPDMIPFNYDISQYSETLKQDLHGYAKKMAILTDVSPTVDDMEFLLNHFDKIIWLDHHSTSLTTIDRLKDNDKAKKKLYYAIDTRFSAAYLNFMIFNQILMDKLKTKELDPIFPALVSIYDTKQDKVYPSAYKYGLYLNQYFTDVAVLEPSSSLWEEYLIKLYYGTDKHKYLDQVLEVGKSLLNLYYAKMEILYKNEYKYIFKYRNYTIKCINGIGNSLRFCNDTEADIYMIARMKSNGKFTLSAYSDDEKVKKVGLGNILKKWFNGGGHPGAAGFVRYADMILDDFECLIKFDDFNTPVEDEGLEEDISKELKKQFPSVEKGVYPYQPGAINRVEPIFMKIFYVVSAIIFYELHLNSK